MINPPKTLEEARAHRYNEWAGNPEGNKWRGGYCAYEMFSSILSLQCGRRLGHGPANLYCKQHAKMVEGE